MITREQLGARLRWIRNALQIRQEDAAAACEKAGPWLSAVEAARTILNVEDLLSLLQFYRVPPALLFSEDRKGEMDHAALAEIVAKARPWQQGRQGNRHGRSKPKK